MMSSSAMQLFTSMLSFASPGLCLSSTPLSAYVITDNQSLAEARRFKATLGTAFSSIKFSDPVYINESALERLVAEGTVSRNYTSWRKEHADPSDEMAEFRKEIGSGLAHRHAWQQFLNQNHAGVSAAWAAIFENDPIMRYDFADRVAALQAQLASITGDVIYLGHCFEEPPNRSAGAFDIGGNVYVARSNHPLCIHAYLISVRGAQRLLNLTVPLTTSFDDMMIAFGNLDLLSVWPSISSQPWQEDYERRHNNLLSTQTSHGEQFMAGHNRLSIKLRGRLRAHTFRPG